MAVDYKKEGRIATFTINRPEAMNAMSVQAWRELGAAMLEFRDDPEVWVGIITAVGEKAFCAGADIKDLLPFMKEKRETPWHMPATHMRGLDLWKPLIAAINGVALGGGLEIVLGCDIRIAAEHARFGVPEVTLGIFPGFGGTQRLSRLIGKGKAKELIMTGKMISAQEAYEMGIVNRIFPQSSLMEATKKVASQIAGNGPVTVRLAKMLIDTGFDMDFLKACSLESHVFSLGFATEDQKEGMTAFIEKRKPNYKGR